MLLVGKGVQDLKWRTARHRVRGGGGDDDYISTAPRTHGQRVGPPKRVDLKVRGSMVPYIRRLALLSCSCVYRLSPPPNTK